MPKLTKCLPRLCQDKSSGQGVIRIDGRKLYLGRWGSAEAKANYDRVIGEWLTNGRRLPTDPSIDPELTLNQLILEYFRFAEGYYVKNGKPTNEIHTIRQALRPARSLYGESLTSAFRPMALKAVRNQMIELDWCRRHVNKQINRVRRMFKWGVENELVALEVYQALQTVSGLSKGRSDVREGKSVQPVAGASVQAVLPLLGRHVAAMVEIQRLPGMRPGEVVVVRERDLKMSGSVWVYQPASHKTQHHGRVRSVCIGPRAQEIIKRFLTNDPNEYLFDPRETEQERNARRRGNRKTPLWPSHVEHQAKKRGNRTKIGPGEHYTEGSYRQAIQRACDRAGIARWNPHQLRHARATEIRSKYGLEAAQVILGHASADVSQVYAERDFSLALKIMKDVG